MYSTDTRTRSVTNATFAVVVSDSSRTQTFSVDRELCHQRQTVLSEQLQASRTAGHQPVVLQGEYDLDGFESYVEYVNSEGEVSPEFDNGDCTIMPLLRLCVIAHQLRDYTAANNLIDENHGSFRSPYLLAESDRDHVCLGDASRRQPLA
jgi:hypothetical protein